MRRHLGDLLPPPDPDATGCPAPPGTPPATPPGSGPLSAAAAPVWAGLGLLVLFALMGRRGGAR